MTKLEQAARQALDVLVKSNPITSDEVFRKVEAIFSLRVALAEPERTPTAALKSLRDVVIERNRLGMDWGPLFGRLMTALSQANEALAEIEPQCNKSATNENQNI